MATQHHNISLRVNDVVIDRWQRYSITNDMLTPADAFELELSPGVKSAYDLVPPDSVVEVRIDDTPVLTGIIDDRSLNFSKSGGTTLSVTGRDKSSRMLDESADLFTFGKLDLGTLAQLLAGDTFAEIRLDNRLNRDLVRGLRSGRAPAGNEPLFVKRSAAPKKVEIGQTPWEVLQFFLEPAQLLAWSTGDGSALVIGLPNYTQQPQFRFFLPSSGSSRITEGNIKDLSFADSVANRYSEIQVLGKSRGKKDAKGKRAKSVKHRAFSTFGPELGGTGDAITLPASVLPSFKVRKRLLLHDPDVADSKDAQDRADREMALRNAEGLVVELTVAGHSQARKPGEIPAVFAFDTMAELEIEPIGFKSQFLITSAVFGVDRTGGEVTQIKMVPKGTELVT